MATELERSPRDRAVMDLRPYLDDRDYDRDVFVRETRGFCEMALSGMLEAGKRLICLKQMEGHGQFLSALEEIGLAYQRANELMAIAFMVTNHIGKLPDSGNLKRLETMGKTRLLLLARLPEDVLEQFGEEGTVAGKTLDEVAAMPLDELRNQVRDLREQLRKGKLQNLKLQADKDRAAEKIDALLGKGDPADLTAAKTAADKLFTALMLVIGMIGNEEFKEIFDTPEKVALLRASDGMRWELVRKWEAFAEAVELPE